MSLRKEHIMSLAGGKSSSISKEELLSSFGKHLKNGVHGICFSSYVDGQEPGDIISAEQIRKRIEVIKPYAKWVRTFSCTDGNELIPAIAKENGLKVMVGAWLSDDKELNEKEITNLIEVAKAGHADLVAVGNEVLYRKELTEEEREKVRSFLARAKESGISVTESEDGFGEWTGSSTEDDVADVDEDEDSI